MLLNSLTAVYDEHYKTILINYDDINTRVSGKTSLHAVLDYDDEEEESLDYYEETYSHGGVTPIQGPIFLRNGSVPVVPLYGYQKVSNGSLLQIPVSAVFVLSLPPVAAAAAHPWVDVDLGHTYWACVWI